MVVAVECGEGVVVAAVECGGGGGVVVAAVECGKHSTSNSCVLSLTSSGRTSICTIFRWGRGGGHTINNYCYSYAKHLITNEYLNETPPNKTVTGYLPGGHLPIRIFARRTSAHSDICPANIRRADILEPNKSHL